MSRDGGGWSKKHQNLANVVCERPLTCSAAMDKMPLPQSSTSERQQESGTELDSAENVVFSQSKYS